MRSLLLLSLLVVACAPCPPRSVPADSVCLKSTGPLVPDQPFVVTASNTGAGLDAPTCEVTFDGDTITLTMRGAECPGQTNNNPVVPVTQVNCDIPALDAGTYTLSGVTVTPGAADAGLQNCR
jgi:hypothetical protein